MRQRRVLSFLVLSAAVLSLLVFSSSPAASGSPAPQTQSAENSSAGTGLNPLATASTAITPALDANSTQGNSSNETLSTNDSNASTLANAVNASTPSNETTANEASTASNDSTTATPAANNSLPASNPPSNPTTTPAPSPTPTPEPTPALQTASNQSYANATQPPENALLDAELAFIRQEASASHFGGFIPPAFKATHTPLDPLLASQVQQAQLQASAFTPPSSNASEQEQAPLIDVLMAGNEGELARITRAAGGKVLHSFKYASIVYARVPASAVNDLQLLPSVRSLHANHAVKATATDYENALVGAQAAWKQGANGTGVVMAFLDSGLDSKNPEFTGRIVGAHDFSGTGTTNDVLGHGTFVAGIAAGSNSSGGLLNGVAPAAFILNAKVLNDSGAGTVESVMEALEWAANPYGNGTSAAKVVSISFGGAYLLPNDPLYTEITSLTDRGILVVASSGNCGSTCPSSSCGGFTGVTTPGSAPDALTVGAVDDSLKPACFSGGGIVDGETKPDLVAPGVGVESILPGGGLMNATGTSMSAPFASGAAADMLQKYPGLSPRTLKLVLEATANNLGNPSKNTLTGSGLLNLASAVNVNASDYANLSITVPPFILRADAVTVTVNTTVNASSVAGSVFEQDTGTQTTLSFTRASGFSWTANIAGSLTLNQSTYLVTAFAGAANASTAFTARNYSLSAPAFTQFNSTPALNFRYADFDSIPHNVIAVMQVFDATGYQVFSSQSAQQTVQPGSTQSFNWLWAPNGTGWFTVQALLFADGSPAGTASQQTYVSMPLVGIPLQLYPPANATKGQNASYTLYAGNTGGFPITASLVVNAVFGSRLLELFSSPPTTLAPGASANLTATGVTPLQGGNYSILAILAYGDQQIPSGAALDILVPQALSINASIPATVAFNQSYNISINATNAFNQTLDALFYADLLKDGLVIQTTAIGGLTAPASDFKGEWWNPAYANCANLTIWQPGQQLSVANAPVRAHVTNLAKRPDNNDVRIVNAPCGQTKAQEIPRDVANSTNTTADAVFEANYSAGANTTYSVYYNNPQATPPSYATDLSSSQAYEWGGNLTFLNNSLIHAGFLTGGAGGGRLWSFSQSGDGFSSEWNQRPGQQEASDEGWTAYIVNYSWVFYGSNTTAACARTFNGSVYDELQCTGPGGTQTTFRVYAYNPWYENQLTAANAPTALLDFEVAPEGSTAAPALTTDAGTIASTNSWLTQPMTRGWFTISKATNPGYYFWQAWNESFSPYSKYVNIYGTNGGGARLWAWGNKVGAFQANVSATTAVYTGVQSTDSNASTPYYLYAKNPLQVLQSPPQPPAPPNSVTSPLSFTTRSGSVTVRVRAEYEGQETKADYPVFVNDSASPVVSLTAPSSANQFAPVLVNATVIDRSDVNITITASDGSRAYNLSANAFSSGNATYVFAVHSHALTPGNDSVTVTACDEQRQCASKTAAVPVTACKGTRLLVVEDSPELSWLLNSSDCVTAWPKNKAGAVPSDYLTNFAAVLWNSGNSFSPATSAEATSLNQYYAAGGRLALSGSNVFSATAFSDANASTALNALAGVILAGVNPLNSSNQNASITTDASEYHPITYSFTNASPAGVLSFNASASELPDGVLANGSQALAWFNETSFPAILVSHQGNGKLAVFPFDFPALAGNASRLLASSTVAWLLQNASQNISLTALSPASYLVSGRSPQATLSGRFSTPALIDFFVNNSLTATVLINSSSFSTPSSVNFSIPDAPGAYFLYARAKPANAGGEADYSQNSINSTVRVAIAGPDVQFSGFSLASNASNSSLVKAVLQNTGGNWGNGTLSLYANSSLKASANITLAPGASSTYPLAYSPGAGAYNLTVNASVANDSDYASKSVSVTAFGCSKQKLLIVSDDNVSYNDSSQSANEFNRILLQSYGYCPTVWDSAAQGPVNASTLSPYPAVVWSAGNNYGGTLASAQATALQAYAGPVLFEGGNLLYDNQGNRVVASLLDGSLAKAEVLSNDSRLSPNASSPLLAGVSSLVLNASLDSYADSVATNGQQAAGWPDGSGAAVSSWVNGGRSFAYYSFSLPAVEDPPSRFALVNNTVAWLLSQKPFAYSRFGSASVWGQNAFSKGGFNNTQAPDSSSVYAAWNASSHSFAGRGTYYSPPLAISHASPSQVISLNWSWYEAGGMNSSDSPVLDLPFENDSKDSSHFNNSGVMIGAPTYVSSCQIGSCLNFSNNGFVQIPVGSFLNLSTGPFTVSVWFNPGSTSATDSGIFSQGNAGEGSGCSWHVATYLYCYAGSAQPNVNIAANIGKWQHLVLTWDGTTTANHVIIYLNGSQVTTGTATHTYSPSALTGSNSGFLRVGSMTTNFTGQIDALHVWNRSLSQGEVLALYNWEKGGGKGNNGYIQNFTNVSLAFRGKSYSFNDSGLVGWWDLGDSSDNETMTNSSLDLSGNGYNGGLVGSSPVVSGVVGNALNFSGSGQYVDLNKRVIGEAGQATSIDFWFNATGKASTDSGLVIDGAAGRGFGCTYHYGNTLWCYAGASVQISHLTSSNAWHNVAFTYNGTHPGGQAQMWVDGVSVTNGTESTAKVENGIGLLIGRSSTDFNGVIDDVKVWNRSISGAEIVALYNSGNPANSTGQESNWTHYALNPPLSNSIAYLSDRAKNYSFNASGLVGWWDLGDSSPNESLSNQSIDLSGNGYNGGLVGSSPVVSGVVGNALNFSGSGQYVDLNKRVIGEAGQATSIDFWFNATSKAASDSGLVMDGAAGNGFGCTYHIGVIVYCYAGSSVQVNHAISANAWHNVAFTYNGTHPGGQAQLWIDGVNYANGTESSAKIENGIGLLIGRGSTDFSGVIDDVKVWNRSLSAAEVSALYNNGCPTCSGGQESNWTAWTGEYFGGNASVFGVQANIAQFRATLTTQDTGKTAFLENASIGYGS